MIAFQHVSVARTTESGRPFWVEDVSFQVEDGEIFGIAGHEGSGKATLLRTMNGLVTPTRGEVLVDGQPVSRLSNREILRLRQKIGMVLSTPALMENVTLFDNIALPLLASGAKKAEAEERIKELLVLTDMEGLSGAYPSALTKEQQKRGAIARALSGKPKLLICMEPTAGLSPSAGDQLLNLLAKLNKSLGLTIVVSASDLNVIKCICDRAAILQAGKVVEIKDTFSLFSAPEHPFTREFLAQQLSFDLPPDVKEHAVGTIVSIEYKGDPANEPVLYETAQRFGVEFNILQGRIEYIGGQPLGKMYVSFNAEPALMVSVLGYLKSHTYRAEVVHDA